MVRIRHGYNLLKNKTLCPRRLFRESSRELRCEALRRQLALPALGIQHVECVGIGRIDVALCLYSGGLQILNIGECLTVKRLAISDKGIARGQVDIIGLSGWRGVGGYYVFSVPEPVD